MSFFSDRGIEGSFKQSCSHKKLQLISLLHSSNELRVEIYDGDLNLVCGGDIEVSSDGKISTMSWHPTQPILLLGSSIGTIYAYECSHDTFKLASKFQHSSSSTVSTIHWSQTGQKLFVSDEKGNISLWSFVAPQSVILQKSQELDSLLDIINIGESSILFSISGDVYIYGDDGFQKSDILFSSSEITAVAVDQPTETLYALERNFTLSRLSFKSNQPVIEKQIRLNVQSNIGVEKFNMQCLDENFIAVSYGGPTVKLIHVLSDEAIDLEIPNTENTRIRNLVHDKHNRLLVAGTDSGHLNFWRYSKNGNEFESFEWKMLPKINIGGSINDLSLCSNHLIVALRRNGIKVVQEKPIQYASSKDFICIQTGSTKVAVQSKTKKTVQHFLCERTIKGVALSNSQLLLSADGNIYIWDLDEKSEESRFYFETSSEAIWAIDENSIVCVHDDILELRKSSGAMKAKVHLPESFGVPEYVECGNGLIYCVSTSGKYVLFEIKNDEIIPVRIQSISPHAATISLNSDRSFAGAIVPRENEYELLIQDTQSGNLISSSKWSNLISFKWDRIFPNLISIETKSAAAFGFSRSVISLYFVSKDSGCVLYENWSEKSEVGFLIECSAPYVYGGERFFSDDNYVVTHKFPGFDDVVAQDANSTIESIQIAYLVHTGKFKQALDVAKSVGASLYWDILIKCCLKAGALDEAIQCLNLSQSLPLKKIMRDFSSSPNHHKLEIIGLAHGMSLGKSGGTAWMTLLKKTWFDEPKNISDIEYEKYVQEYDVTLIERRRGNLDKWYAKENEAVGNYQESLECYLKLGKIGDAIRVLCILERIIEATELCEKRRSTEGAFYIGRHFEKIEETREAVKWYTRAKCWHHATRIAMGKDQVLELNQIAMFAPKCVLSKIAKYFIDQKLFDNAANIYFKAREYSKAVEICLEHPEDCAHVLELIAVNLNENSDATLLEKCAYFFLKNHKFDQAALILIKAKKIEKAIEICENHGIEITEEMANKITEALPEEKRVDYLIQLADTCYQQRSFQIACKKYTQAGQRIKALHALLQTGDLEKIIFFTDVSGSKQPEIYIITANYLQTLPWFEDQKITKAIVNFYTKGSAYEQLALFYESCAQFEIDDYSDYERAESALQEAIETINLKHESFTGKQQMISRLTSKMAAVSSFLSAKSSLRSGAQLSEKSLETLKSFTLPNKVLLNPVRAGDAFAEIISYFVRANDKAAVEANIFEMRKIINVEKLSMYLNDDALAYLKSHDLIR